MRYQEVLEAAAVLRQERLDQAKALIPARTTAVARQSSSL